MLRSVVQLLKGQRLTSAVVDDDPPAPSSGDIAQECETHHTQNLLNVNSDLGALREEKSHTEDNYEWVEVDLSPMHSDDIREEVCKVRLTVVGMDQSADCVKLDVREAGGPSSSNSQDANLTDKRGISTEISTDLQHQLQHSITITVQMPPPRQSSLDSCKAQEAVFVRTVSGMSTDSVAEHCRICQLTTEEPLIELGCQCRGELSKTHRTCIQQWFNNKGTNKCEVCRHVATNLPAPIAEPLQNFWAWRMSRSDGRRAFRGWQGRGQYHPLLAALLILVAGLMFDVLISYYLGASALPVNIIIGVLVILGLGTAARLVMECCNERNIRARIRRMEMAADMDHVQLNSGP